MTAPALTFLAPPSFSDGSADTSVSPSEEHRSRRRSAESAPAHRRRSVGALRMTRGARAAATGMKLAEADIQRCLDTPDDVSPDDNSPSRTRFRRGTVVVLTGADGMVLRVERRSR